MFSLRKNQGSMISIGDTKKKEHNPYLIFALLAAVLAGLLVVGAIKAAIPSQMVVVAKETLEPGDKIDKQTVAVSKVPKAAVTGDAMTEEEISKGYRLGATVAKGDIIRKDHLADFIEEGGTVASRALARGQDFRAIALPPEATLGLNLVPGDKLDITGVVDVPGVGGKGTETTSKLLVQAATVLFVPNIDPKSPYAKDAQVVVAVPSTQVPQVSLALAKGSIVTTTNMAEAQSVAHPVTLTGVFGLPEQAQSPQQ